FIINSLYLDCQWVICCFFCLFFFCSNSFFARISSASDLSISFIVFITYIFPFSAFFIRTFPFRYPCLGQSATQQYVFWFNENQRIFFLTFFRHRKHRPAATSLSFMASSFPGNSRVIYFSL